MVMIHNTLELLANLIRYCKQPMSHSLVDIQESPCTDLSNHTWVMNVRFSHSRTFSKCVTHEYTHCLVAIGSVACMFTLVAMYSHWYHPWHLLGTYLAFLLWLATYMPNPLKDHCHTCTAVLLLWHIGPLPYIYGTNAIVTIMLL